MTTVAEYETHPTAAIFPLLSGEALAELAEDIRDNGLVVPIELFDGKILDGRNRYAACQQAGVEPRFVEVSTTDPVAYVLSLNLHRRHLTPSQTSMVGGRVRGHYDRDAKERRLASLKKGGKKPVVANLPQRETGKSRDHAAKAVGVSGKSIDAATKVLTHGEPELAAAVDGKVIAVSAAAKVAKKPREEQLAAIEAAKSKRKGRAGKGAKEEPAATPPQEPAKPALIDREAYDSALECLAAAKKAIRELARHPEGRFVKPHSASLVRSIEGAMKIVKKWACIYPCPNCKASEGKGGCAVCEGLGGISLAIREAIKREEATKAETT